jgi:drug/metabolite transporter (DMT)-like permease
MIGEYAKKAQMNPGILYGVLSFVIVFNSIYSYFIFKEKITLKMSVGILVVILGVLWISIAKSSPVKFDSTT